MIWFTLLIPVIAVIILKVFFNHKVVLWELVVPLVFGTILTVSAYYITNSVLTSSYEKRIHHPVGATYFEEWDEWIDQTCTRTVSCGKDCTTTETYDCSYRKHHPKQWVALYNSGMQRDIDPSFYEQLLNTWHVKEKFVNMNRDYYRIDGDAYTFNLESYELKNIFPYYTTHRYENKVHASYSVFGYEDVSPEDIKQWGLWKEPVLEGSSTYVPQVLGWDSAYVLEYLAKRNAIIGANKQVMVWVLIHYNSNPYTGQLQESLWKGGHKNEFTISIGLDSLSNKIEWVHPFSWSDSEITKIRIRDYISAKDTLSEDVLFDVLNYSLNEIQQTYVRKSFADFNYLHVEIPLKYVMIVFALQIMLNVGLGFYVVMNQFDYSEKPKYNFRGYYRR